MSMAIIVDNNWKGHWPPPIEEVEAVLYNQQLLKNGILIFILFIIMIFSYAAYDFYTKKENSILLSDDFKHCLMLAKYFSYIILPVVGFVLLLLGNNVKNHIVTVLLNTFIFYTSAFMSFYIYAFINKNRINKVFGFVVSVISFNILCLLLVFLIYQQTI